jgi:hypothetical protein
MKKLFTLLGIFLCIVLATPAHAVTELIRSGTATPIPFLLVDAATGQIGQTGQASNCTVTVCKPGTTSYIASSGTITELGSQIPPAKARYLVPNPESAALDATES